MKKLTLEILSAYLPHQLKLMFEKSGRIITMKSCFNNNDNSDLCITDVKESNGYNFKIWNFKPILYPLSRLTKESFNDNTYIENIVLDSEQHCDAYDEWLESYIDNPDPDRIMQAPYEILHELVKQHYNVFNLADNIFIDKSEVFI